MKKLIIFDCDGVLVDSERLASEALVDCLAEIQVTMDVETALRRFTGRKMADCLADVEHMNQCSLPDKFELTYRSRMNDYFESRLRAIKGVEEAVKKISHAKCVASNGPLEKTKRNLVITNLHHYFGDNVFSAYTIQKWKPEPDLFLHACREMGSHPDHCLVIEDSETGVRAALAGGFRVLAYGHDFQSMTELPDRIEEMLAEV
jgi:HAD superfamily hydrolase (TIGR01509 family)